MLREGKSRIPDLSPRPPARHTDPSARTIAGHPPFDQTASEHRRGPILSIAYGYAFAFVTAIVVIAGDVSLKQAADSGLPLTSRPAVLGAALYVVSAVMWYFAMRHVTLAQAGVAYSMFTLIALSAIGASHFGEDLRARELAGIACALLSMVLLVRVQA